MFQFSLRSRDGKKAERAKSVFIQLQERVLGESTGREKAAQPEDKRLTLLLRSGISAYRWAEGAGGIRGYGARRVNDRQGEVGEVCVQLHRPSSNSSTVSTTTERA